ncbi:TlpA family protein disulfide reductase [Adhaeribacter rhizoryzae]|uniref:AhpC/TSA family protein n=1 Tax=Adhaeribacter rhizoryzae TaxID=2607907 RepID=A0A5M6DIR9_9BACT|nr:TlpA disulfide reductase family protein [Adhaeribacter rhizoryzae]KAA5547468.1 AhpC/TSA family protein [Adhaeribacter rhizoryzae]
MKIKRNILLLVLVLMGFASCQQEVKHLKGRSYKITGEVANCEGCEVKLQLYDFNQYKFAEQTPIRLDSVKNNRFTLKGRTTQAGFYEVHIKDKVTGKPMVAIVYLPAELIHLTADANGLAPGKLQRFQSNLLPAGRTGAFDKISVTSSSPVQADITKFLLLQDSLTVAYLKKEKETYTAFRSTYDSGNPKLINAWADSVQQVPYKYSLYKAYAADLFIRQHPQSEVTILAMLENHHEKTTNYRFYRYFKALPLSKQITFYGQALARKLNLPDKPAKYKQHWVGSSITYLKGKTPDQEELDVKKIFNQNKYTLLTFWASWNVPSRSQMTEYQKIYQQHQKQGFEIIAVSFDQDYRAWTQAIADEALTFRQVSELKGKYADEYRRFRIRDIPFNILFDNRGTMVAVDLTPQEVAQKLKQNL